MYRTRQYFTKGDFKELVKQLEEYVGENKVVLRDDIIENVYYVNRHGKKITMNNRQLGYIVKYSERNDGVTSFFTTKNRERTYYITTKENFDNFIGEKYGR